MAISLGPALRVRRDSLRILSDTGQFTRWRHAIVRGSVRRQYNGNVRDWHVRMRYRISCTSDSVNRGIGQGERNRQGSRKKRAALVVDRKS